MAVTRVLVAILLSYLVVTSAGASAQPLPPDDAGLAASSQLVFSVDVLLDESADPVPLEIRDGQTVAQVNIRYSSAGNGSSTSRLWYHSRYQRCERGALPVACVAVPECSYYREPQCPDPILDSNQLTNVNTSTIRRKPQYPRLVVCHLSSQKLTIFQCLSPCATCLYSVWPLSR